MMINITSVSAARTFQLNDKTNYAFLLTVMAHRSTQIVAAVLFTASLLFLAFLATELAPFTLGALLVGLGMFAGGASLFALNRCAASKTQAMNLENSDNHGL